MSMINVVAIYVDSVKWVELEVDDETLDQNPSQASYGIMDGWLKETAHDDCPYDPNWEKDEEWSQVGFYGDEVNAQYTAIFSPYRGERVTFVFWT